MATGIPESILYIAGIVMAAAFMGVFAAVIGESTAEFESRGSDVRNNLATDITLLNDPEQIDDPMVLYVRNDGTTTLVTSDLTVLLDGEASADLTYDILGTTNDIDWLPGDVLEITVNDLSPASGPHRLRVVTPGGIEASLEFVA